MSLIGLGIFWIGVIWLVILSFQRQSSLLLKIVWAVANLFLNPFAGVIFYLVNQSGLIPALLCVAGLLLTIFGGLDFLFTTNGSP